MPILPGNLPTSEWYFKGRPAPSIEVKEILGEAHSFRPILRSASATFSENVGSLKGIISLKALEE